MDRQMGLRSLASIAGWVFLSGCPDNLPKAGREYLEECRSLDRVSQVSAPLRKSIEAFIADTPILVKGRDFRLEIRDENDVWKIAIREDCYAFETSRLILTGGNIYLEVSKSSYEARYVGHSM